VINSEGLSLTLNIYIISKGGAKVKRKNQKSLTFFKIL
jgi:hypothetical protein